MKRPTGVTILAILWFLGAAFLLLSSIGLLIGGAALREFLANTPGLTRITGGLVTAFGAIVLFFAVIYAITGYGLLALKNWGRILSITITSLGFVGELIGFGWVFSNLTLWNLGWQAFKAFVCLLIIAYFFQDNVKLAFGQAVQPSH